MFEITVVLHMQILFIFINLVFKTFAQPIHLYFNII